MTSSDPSAVAGVRARIELGRNCLAEGGLGDALDVWEPMAAALLAVLDLADDAARQGMGAEACFLAEDIEAAVVAAFQPKEDETGPGAHG